MLITISDGKLSYEVRVSAFLHETKKVEPANKNVITHAKSKMDASSISLKDKKSLSATNDEDNLPWYVRKGKHPSHWHCN
jgi:hypothetical protein